MPQLDTTPKPLKPFINHGVNLEASSGDQAIGDCPFCGKEGKFWVNIKTGQWDCKVCGEKGNAVTFLRLLWDRSDKETEDYEGFAADRTLLYPETLMRWGVCKSIINDRWMVPGYNVEGKMVQLYQYTPVMEKGEWVKRLLPTPEMGGHGFHRSNFYDPKKPNLYICEGPWDGLAWCETLRRAKEDGENLAVTGAESSSLYATASVIATPGANVFQENWCKVASGKHIFLMYDSDHPRQCKGGKVVRTGFDGMQRVAEMLSRYEQPPAGIYFIKWGEEGYDPSLADGYDLRDSLNHPTIVERVSVMRRVLHSVEPIPAEWVKGRTSQAQATGGTEIECLPCSDWSSLQNTWRKAMHWTEGLDRTLSVMLASVTSTKSVGDQLWIKVIGPPSSGKSTLCEAISINKKNVLALSTIRGFHSGFKDPDAGGANISLIIRLNGKTLVTKDGDSLLTAPNKDQILGEARDLYDGTARSDYRNGMGKAHEGIRVTWILCGTGELKNLDTSELGARFLDCYVMEEICDELEDSIGLSVAYRALRGVSAESNGEAESQYDPDLLQAMQLTGGYVNYLRDNAQMLLTEVGKEVLLNDEHMLHVCAKLAKFVSYIRARPSKKQDEMIVREMSARLVSQLTRLALCLSVVLCKKTIDKEVLRRVTRVAMDTAKGRTLNIVRKLFPDGAIGTDIKHISHLKGETEDKLRPLLYFMRAIGIVEVFSVKEIRGLAARPKWRLTDSFYKLYEEVLRSGEAQPTSK